jgi:hypothetical protein
MRALYIGFALILAACGSHDGDNDGDSPANENNAKTAEVGTEGPTSLTLETPADLPECNEARNRQLIYIIETEEFQTCKDGAWVVVTIPVPEATPEPLDLNRLHNAIMTIDVSDNITDPNDPGYLNGDTMESMIPEAREYLLSLGEREEINATTVDYTLAKLAAAGAACEWEYYYLVKFRSGSVISVYDGCAN